MFFQVQRFLKIETFDAKRKIMSINISVRNIKPKPKPKPRLRTADTDFQYCGGVAADVRGGTMIRWFSNRGGIKVDTMPLNVIEKSLCSM